MKKGMAMVLVFVMILAAIPVFAAQEDSQKMQEVLLLVKEKVSVPEELSEFSGRVSEYNERVSYHFEWTTPDYEKFMSVSCDMEGRITSYHQRIDELSEKHLSDVSKAEMIAFGEQFLRTTVPEAFVDDTDLLVYDEEGYYASGNLMYNLVFQRKKNGVEVKDNYANVCLCIIDDTIQVRSMDIQFAYDAKFEEPKQEIENSKEVYMELFPVELIYRDEYQALAKKEEEKFIPKLVYRIKDDEIGYMSLATGEVLVEDAWEEAYKNAPEAEDAVTNLGTVGGGSLTPQEMEELRTIEGLLGSAEIMKRIRKLPYLDLSDELEQKSSDLYQDEFGNYCYRIHYSQEEEPYRGIYLRVNAKTGELLDLSNYSSKYSDSQETKELTDAEKSKAEKKVHEFLTLVAKEKLAGTEKLETTVNEKVYSENYRRVVNDVPYIDNGIHISFDGKNNVVRNYSLRFTEGTFEDPADVVGDGAAYERILEEAPIKKVYLKSGGVYQKVITLGRRVVAVDAISGEFKNKDQKQEYQYTDLSGHWVEKAAIKLGENQIGLPGDTLEPEASITQEDFLRLLASAVLGQYYRDLSSEVLYDRLIREKILGEEEKNPEHEVLREDAFVYTIRMAGLEKVAKLSDIYKVSYGDQAELSEGRIGYAAILSGLGVVCGDGGNLRPRSALTRAEAIAIVYRYLLAL